MRLLAAAALLASRVVGFGINLGNVLEAPTEGAWAPAAQEFYFDDYLAAGFEFVRVPVRWDQHTGTAAPFAVDAKWMARVLEVVGWATSRNLTAIVNSHHDDWFDSNANYASELPRFLAIWQQIAAAFVGVPDALLRFEVINEPINLNISQLNDAYSKVLPIIRAAHPTRPVYLGGLSWMSPSWIEQNPFAVQWATGDANLRLEVHSYDPYAFCLESPPAQQTWGLPADVAAVESMFAATATWQSAHGHRVLMGESGCQVTAPSRADRLQWYNVTGAASRALADGLSIWDDDGDWKVYDRVARTWDEGVLQALGMAA